MRLDCRVLSMMVVMACSTNAKQIDDPVIVDADGDGLSAEQGDA